MSRWLPALLAFCGLAGGALSGQAPKPSGVISGVVTDELNRPVPGVMVGAFRLANGQIVLPRNELLSSIWPQATVQKETNDLGEFRLWPVERGEYVVAVVVTRVAHHVDDNVGGCVPSFPSDWFGFVPVARLEPVERLLDASRKHYFQTPLALTPPAETQAGDRGYITTFSPRATDLNDARHVILSDKQHEGGVDIQLQLRPAVRVTGRVAGPRPAALDLALTTTLGGASTRTAADGSFVFLNIPVGAYALVSPGTTSTCDTIGRYGPSYEGRADITVERGDQNHFVFIVGSQPSVQRAATQATPITRPANAGTITGVVTTDAGQALDRVRVRVTSSSLPDGATAVTAADGRFVIDNLPPDVFTLTLSRAGFADHLYGQRRPGRAGTPIQIAAGQRFEANVVMTRPGVIAGVVRNERGEPMPGVNVCCAKYWTDTDDRGQYRLWPVPAGDRTVVAYDARGRGVFKGYQRTYYPGVIDEAVAGKVHVDPGSVQAIDITAQPLVTGENSSLTVRVRSANGALGTRLDVYISGVTQNRRDALPVATGDPSELVAFFPSVPAGKHLVYTGANYSDRSFGSAEVVTDGRTPSSVSIVTAPKIGLTLTATFNGPGDRIKFFQWMLFSVTDSLSWNSVAPGPASGTWLDDAGRAILSDLRPGRYVLRITPDGPWTAASARLGGREILDAPFTLDPGSQSELSIQFTSRRTSLEGVVRDAVGGPSAATDVLIFSLDRQFWTPGSRRIRLVRPRSDGHYEVSGLPPGEYVVIAEKEIDPDDVNPDWLQAHSAGAARVTLAEGKPASLNVRVQK